MKIKLSGNLARFVNYKKELKLEGDGIQTVGDALHALVVNYPVLKDIIFDKNHSVKKGYLISLNGEKVDAAVKVSAGGEGDCLDIFTAIAGG
ncbi:MoaD/ThiS family protein [Pseudomonas fragi]|uniref:MoaD/ThiS family protein n=1 Tax=Pseudomonas fragi TaxID=296 RepID=UPI0002E14A8C|nr:MoaD/ThiS family protein [Pseudomonas fragi]MDE4514041.1 MoaD/ThiS family protein [Pseudomonas fragi]NNA99830.1 MoaD/ThiS family protein [Pseudomonas fragi]NNB58077.1 MoaD/ThiS family protein [Pseudomonas fragi]QPC34570.1 MoaD/ThiS family protein [Pseudomonas fragi]SDU65790.1 molybdopterin synthase sulfur carrier subunit [Pseudomonas fragi]